MKLYFKVTPTPEHSVFQVEIVPEQGRNALCQFDGLLGVFNLFCNELFVVGMGVGGIAVAIIIWVYWRRNRKAP